jgi:hypothetical protein
MTKRHTQDPVDRAITFVRLHARRDPLYAKGPDKARIVEAREISAALDAATPAPADDTVKPDDVQAKLDQYRTAWEALFGPLSWLQYSDQLTAYAGWGLSEIANDLIDRAYPGLRADALAAKEARAHG